MFRYYLRTYDLFDGKPLTCLAILGDEDPNWRPQGLQAEWWGTKVDFQFRSIKLLDFADQQERLESSSNPFARFVWAHLKTVQTKEDYETRLQWKLRIIKRLYDMGVSEAEIGQLYHDFDWLLTLPEGLARRYHREMTTFKEERTMPHMTTAERIGRIDGRKEGRKEGKAEGKIEGKVLLLKAMLEQKFGPLSVARIAALQSMHDADLTQIGIRLLTAQTLDELLP